MSLGFVFPGQGSQAVGMLDALADEPVVRATFDEAAQALDFDLWVLVHAGPAERLNETANTQPAMLAAGVACWRLWQERGGAEPAVMAGHSLGEYTALVCAGALDFADALHLVRARGRFMQEAVPAGEGAMAAILGLDDDTVKRICAEAAGDRVVEAVNFNAPGQVVVAGHADAVARAVEQAKAAGARRALVLPVSVPSHCSLMRPAAERLAAELKQVDLRPPRIPVINNVDVAAPDDPEAIRDALVRQLHSPVRWVEVIQAMRARGVERLIECGPGKVLTGLVKRIDRALAVQPVFDADSLAQALSA